MLLAFADEVGVDGPVAVRGGGTRWDLGGACRPSGTRIVSAPSGIVTYAPEEMTVRVRAGTHGRRAARRAGRQRGQRTSLVERGGTVGGAVMVGENDIHTLGRGTLRSSVLQVRYVSADGRVVNGGGPTVKNVTGFDLPRLMVGSLGTLGLLAEVILRTNPIPPASMWLAADGRRPVRRVRRAATFEFGAVGRRDAHGCSSRDTAPTSTPNAPCSVGSAGSNPSSGPPVLPTQRWSLAPAELRSLPLTLAGSGDGHGSSR